MYIVVSCRRFFPFQYCEVASCYQRHQQLQVLCSIPMPSHLRFWALDSGTRHSTGGMRYTSVRTAAFMGLQYVQAAIQVRLECTAQPVAFIPFVTWTWTIQERLQWFGDRVSCKVWFAMQNLTDTPPHKRTASQSLPALALPRHLCEISPSAWDGGLSEMVPESIRGDDFKKRFTTHLDDMTEVLAANRPVLLQPA
jgi:hypothetical protein